ncbi:MAG: flagellar motor switch protein FliN [Firmicutes bacterium]|nr:flagellar motor switch protein FliN [Bacillota bacterium]
MSENAKSKLTEMQKNILREIGDACISSAAAALHDILNRKVTAAVSKVSVITTAELTKRLDLPHVTIDIPYTEGIAGNNTLVVKTSDVQLITSVMVDNSPPGKRDGLTPAEQGAADKVMNQIIGSVSTELSKLIATSVSISTPKISVAAISENSLQLSLKSDPIVAVMFSLKIEQLLDTEVTLLMPFKFGKSLTDRLLKANHSDDKAENSTNAEHQNVKGDNIKSATFQSFDGKNGIKPGGDNIELLLDVPLQLVVELGRTKRYLKDILDLNLGSIIPLDKPAGDLIDVLVNGKLIAKGEVVVIDDNFGVRITDIVSSVKK